MGRTERIESVTTNSTIDVDGVDIDEYDAFHGGIGDPDLESVAHLRASSSLSLRTLHILETVCSPYFNCINRLIVE